MAKDKKSFMLYCDQRGVFDKLPDEDAGKLIKHIFSYVNDENPKGEFVIELAFELIKQQLKRDLKKYESRADRSRENGKKGGRPKTQKTQQVILEPRKPDTVTVTDTVTVIEKNKNKKEPIEHWVKLDANGFEIKQDDSKPQG